MCGFVGIFAYHPVAPQVDRDELFRIRDHMKSRGPDGEGAWFSPDGQVGLGHRRLSIIDLSEAGNQPMTNEDGSVWIVFNGEIYNYQPLRESLIQSGHRFRSTSDTEVLLHLYEEKGEAMIHDLRGMFAFSLWDSRTNTMLLVRDPYGIKPLYYSDDGWTVRAASQVKALLEGKVSRTRDPAGLTGFYLFGSVPEPFTLYQEIRAVPAGCIVRVDRLGASKPEEYFSIARVFRDAQGAQPLPANEVSEVIRDALLDSVRHHLIADVPVGAFLSAGIDSGATVALAREVGYDLRTVTLAFTEYRGTDQDESPLAIDVAKQYGVSHTVRPLDQSEFHRDLSRILEVMDQPSIDGINTYFVSKAAAEMGMKVALSGLGGDELFAGYSTFRDVPHWVRKAALPAMIPGIGRLFRYLTAPLLPNRVSPKSAGALEFGGTYPGAYLLRRGLFMPWELGALMGEEMAKEGMRRLAPLSMIRSTLRPDPKSAYARVSTLESSLYMRNQLLRDADWASMAHSLEVRVPLVDVNLLKTLAPILYNLKSPFQKQMLAHTPLEPLPSAVNTRAKTGFNIPIGPWLEKSRSLDVWRRVPSLQRSGTNWARRLAYSLTGLEAF